MYNKDKEEEKAIAEADALRRQGRSFRDERVRLMTDYNKTIFDRLFMVDYSE